MFFLQFMLNLRVRRLGRKRIGEFYLVWENVEDKFMIFQIRFLFIGELEGKDLKVYRIEDSSFGKILFLGEGVIFRGLVVEGKN